MDRDSKVAHTEYKKNRYALAIWEQIQPLRSQSDIVSITELSDLLNNYHSPFLKKQKWNTKSTRELVERLVQQKRIKADAVLHPLTEPGDIKDFMEGVREMVAEITQGQPLPVDDIVKTLNDDQCKSYDARDWTTEKLVAGAKQWARNGQAKLSGNDGHLCLQTIEKTNQRTQKADQFACNIAPVIRSITRNDPSLKPHKIALIMNSSGFQTPQGKEWQARSADNTINRCKRLGLLD